jgi:hypothetical protein
MSVPLAACLEGAAVCAGDLLLSRWLLRGMLMLTWGQCYVFSKIIPPKHWRKKLPILTYILAINAEK